MKLCNDTITVFNAHVDQDAGGNVWTPTVVTGASWYLTDASTVDASKGGLVAANKATIRIPEDANTSGKTIDWYMLNEILKSLEDTGKHNPSGGAYSYLLTYRSSGGTVTTLYDSDTVGGEQSVVNTAIEGLKEVDSNLKSYMYLETMQSGRTGIVTLKVSLDGESQGNVYQESIADLRLRFAAEVTPGYNIIKTGDDSIKLMPFYIGMVAAGLLFIVFAATGLLEKKKKGGESK